MLMFFYDVCLAVFISLNYCIYFFLIDKYALRHKLLSHVILSLSLFQPRKKKSQLGKKRKRTYTKEDVHTVDDTNVNETSHDKSSSGPASFESGMIPLFVISSLNSSTTITTLLLYYYYY